MEREKVRTKNIELEKERMDAIRKYMRGRPRIHSRITVSEASKAIGWKYATTWNFFRKSAFFEPTKIRGEYILLKIPGMANSGPADLRSPIEPHPGKKDICESEKNAWEEANNIIKEAEEQEQTELKRKNLKILPNLTTLRE